MSFPKNIGENIRENLSGKYSQKHIDHAKQSATDTHKTASETAILKIAEPTGDLIGNKIVKDFSKTSSQNNLKTVANEEERYKSPEERQNIIDDVRLF